MCGKQSGNGPRKDEEKLVNSAVLLPLHVFRLGRKVHHFASIPGYWLLFRPSERKRLLASALASTIYASLGMVG
jgi:hypothetical protein